MTDMITLFDRVVYTCTRGFLGCCLSLRLYEHGAVFEQCSRVQSGCSTDQCWIMFKFWGWHMSSHDDHRAVPTWPRLAIMKTKVALAHDIEHGQHISSIQTATFAKVLFHLLLQRGLVASGSLHQTRRWRELASPIGVSAAQGH